MNTLYSIVFTLTVLAGVLWGLVGLGGFLGRNLNIVSMITRTHTVLEYVIYVVFGIAAVVYVWISSRQ